MQTAVAEIMLNRSRVLPIVGQLVAAAVPQHVAVDEKGKPRCLSGSGQHALIATHAYTLNTRPRKRLERPGRRRKEHSFLSG